MLCRRKRTEPDPGLWTALSVRFNSWVTHLIIERVNILQERLTSRLLSNQGSVRLRILELAEPNNLRLSPSASHNLLPSHWRETCSQRKLMDSSCRHDTPETSNCYFIHMVQRGMINGNLETPLLWESGRSCTKPFCSSPFLGLAGVFQIISIYQLISIFPYFLYPVT